ncbi:MAG: hypothetical protein AB7U05_08990 [Mangrovibacterium sp.]
MNKQVQAAAAKALSSNFLGYEGQQYTGMGDLSIDFAGSSFLDEDKKVRTFAITATNTGSAAEDRVLALHPGFLTALADMTDSAGTAAAAIVTDGTIIATADKEVVCSGKPKKIAHFKDFVNQNPTRLTGIKMLVNNSDQFEEDITVKKLSPFKNLEDMIIQPSIYKDSNQTDDKRVEIPLEDFQIDNQTLIVFTLKAGRTVTFTFFAGAIKNQAAELHNKASLARLTSGRQYK